MRSGLGRQLDRAIDGVTPGTLESRAFRRLARERAWSRAMDGVDQLLAIAVDARSARDGFLEVRVQVGLTYAWEEEPEVGPALAGRVPAHHPPVHPTQLQDPTWRYMSDSDPWFAHTLSEHLTNVVLPTLDRWRDPRSLRDHYLSRGWLEHAVRLSVAIGDEALARLLVVTLAEHALHRIEVEPGTWPRTPGAPLELAADLGVRLPAERERRLRDALADAVADWRARGQGVPPWVAELERRFIAPAGENRAEP